MRADAIVATLGEARGETDVYAPVDDEDGEATIATWGVDQIVNGASFAECAAGLAEVVWETNGGFADVEAAGTCLEHLDQAHWRAGPAPGPRRRATPARHPSLTSRRTRWRHPSCRQLRSARRLRSSSVDRWATATRRATVAAWS